MARNWAACPLAVASAATVLKGCDAFFKHTSRRIHNPRVNVPELLERKQGRRVVRIGKCERCGLVDRNGTGPGGWVRFETGVQRPRVKSKCTLLLFFFRHMSLQDCNHIIAQPGPL